MSIDDVLRGVARGAWANVKPRKQVLSARGDAPAEDPSSTCVHMQLPDTTSTVVAAVTPVTPISTSEFDLPVGVRLIRRTSVHTPSGQPHWRNITDRRKFITAQLADLDARLHSPVQIRGGGSVFEILSTLAGLGLELAIERPAIEPQAAVSTTAENSKETP